MSDVVPLFARVIVLKEGTTYDIPADDPGKLFSERYPGVTVPRLRNARIYQTPDGPVFAVPEEDRC